jgi:RimJ/RimL family protein N-acetyltransferase
VSSGRASIPGVLRPHYPLATERLELRPLRLDDLDDLLVYHSRPDVTRYLYWEPRDRPRMLEALRQRMRMSIACRGARGLVKTGKKRTANDNAFALAA